MEDVRADYCIRRAWDLSAGSWFGFVPDQDIKLALEAVKRESSRHKTSVTRVDKVFKAVFSICRKFEEHAVVD